MNTVLCSRLSCSGTCWRKLRVMHHVKWRRQRTWRYGGWSSLIHCKWVALGGDMNSGQARRRSGGAGDAAEGAETPRAGCSNLCQLWIFIMAVFPQKAMEGDTFWSCLAVYMLYIYGTSMLCYRYTIYREQNGPAKSVSELLKYLPVSELQYRIFKFKKFIKPCFFLTLFILAAKIGISLLAYHSITVWDVLVPVIFYLLLPMILFFPARKRVH